MPGMSGNRATATRSQLCSYLAQQLGFVRRMQKADNEPDHAELAQYKERVCAATRRLAAQTPGSLAEDLETTLIGPLQDAADSASIARALSESIQALAPGGRKASSPGSALSTDTADVARALGAAGDDVACAASQLWELDGNRLTPGADYELDLQGVSRGLGHDGARAPLFVHMDDRVWQRRTYAAFMRLLDNYTADTGVAEEETRAEREEQREFVGLICETACMRFVFEWLRQHSQMRVQSMEEFCEMIDTLWFDGYRRGAARDSSSGFEHVFCGEVDDGRVKGMHNFLQVYLEEKHGELDYKGYLPPLPRGNNSLMTPSSHERMLCIRFDWKGVTKSVSSVFFGVSPEFEMALYTLFFVHGTKEAVVQLGSHRAKVRVHSLAGKIGSAYPEAVAPSKEEAATAITSVYRRRKAAEELAARKDGDQDLAQRAATLIRVGQSVGKVFGWW